MRNKIVWFAVAALLLSLFPGGMGVRASDNIETEANSGVSIDTLPPFEEEWDGDDTDDASTAGLREWWQRLKETIRDALRWYRERERRRRMRDAPEEAF